MIFRTWKYICSLAVWVFIRFHIYRGWSWLYRQLFERKYRSWRWWKEVAFLDIHDVCSMVREMKYRPDGWRQLFDTFSYPQAVLHRKEGDCDDIALFTVWALNQMNIKTFKGIYDRPMRVDRAEVLTVTWMRANGTPGGHNTTLVHVSDPLTGEKAYMVIDYGDVYKESSIEDHVKSIVHYYAGSDAQLMVWSRMSESLKPLEVVWHKSDRRRI